jgi:leader peptidase (prepilin peptidase)/N-methyltransferase
MTTTVIAGALLGSATAPAAAHLAALSARQRIHHPARLQATLAVLAAIFGGVAAARHGLPALATALPALVPAAAAAAVDAQERRLPDPLTAALAVLIAAELAVLFVLDGTGTVRGTWVFVGGAAICLLAKALLPDAIGWGDAKLAPSLVALLAVHGWSALYTGLLAWCALVLVAALLDVVDRTPTGVVVAYGPAMVAGTAFGIAN